MEGMCSVSSFIGTSSCADSRNFSPYKPIIRKQQLRDIYTNYNERLTYFGNHIWDKNKCVETTVLVRSNSSISRYMLEYFNEKDYLTYYAGTRSYSGESCLCKDPYLAQLWMQHIYLGKVYYGNYIFRVLYPEIRNIKEDLPSLYNLNKFSFSGSHLQKMINHFQIAFVYNVKVPSCKRKSMYNLQILTINQKNFKEMKYNKCF